MESLMLSFMEKIKNAEDILIVPHVSPDGDALGSCAALKIYMQKLGKNPKLYIGDTVSEKFECVSEYFEVKKETDHVFELVVYVDCADIGRADVIFPKPKFSCAIDHHISNPQECDINIIDGYAPATGEMIYELFDKTNVPLDNEVAKAIYLAILTDTGGFIYESTRKRTIEIIASLYDFDFDRTRIVTQSMLKKSLVFNKLFAYVMANVHVLDNKLAIAFLDNGVYQRNKINPTDTDGLSNALKDIEGISCGILLTEREKGVIKGSIRTDSPIDATQIAGLFGGGGHIRAAGFKTNMRYKEVKDKINGWLLADK